MDSLFGNEFETIVPVVLKTDVNASLLSILPTFSKFNTDKIMVKVVSSGVGVITVNDVDSAKTFKGLLLGFRVKAPNHVVEYAKQQGVTISTFDIVYHLYDLIRDYVQKLTTGSEVHEKVWGTARVKKVFILSEGDSVAGAVITDGEGKRNCMVRVMRENAIIGEYQISSMKVLKEERKEVKKGTEFGVSLGKGADVQEDDTLIFVAK
jgi:translation initiation factor IF-2